MRAKPIGVLYVALTAIIAAALLPGCAASSGGGVVGEIESAVKEKEAEDTAIDAYIFGYPLVTMRLYWPKENPPSILDGTWKIPRVHESS